MSASIFYFSASFKKAREREILRNHEMCDVIIFDNFSIVSSKIHVLGWVLWFQDTETAIICWDKKIRAYD